MLVAHGISHSALDDLGPGERVGEHVDATGARIGCVLQIVHVGPAQIVIGGRAPSAGAAATGATGATATAAPPALAVGVVDDEIEPEIGAEAVAQHALDLGAFL